MPSVYRHIPYRIPLDCCCTNVLHQKTLTDILFLSPRCTWATICSGSFRRHKGVMRVVMATTDRRRRHSDNRLPDRTLHRAERSMAAHNERTGRRLNLQSHSTHRGHTIRVPCDRTQQSWRESAWTKVRASPSQGSMGYVVILVSWTVIFVLLCEICSNLFIYKTISYGYLVTCCRQVVADLW